MFCSGISFFRCFPIFIFFLFPLFEHKTWTIFYLENIVSSLNIRQNMYLNNMVFCRKKAYPFNEFNSEVFPIRVVIDFFYHFIFCFLFCCIVFLKFCFRELFEPKPISTVFWSYIWKTARKVEMTMLNGNWNSIFKNLKVTYFNVASCFYHSFINNNEMKPNKHFCHNSFIICDLQIITFTPFNSSF